VEFASKLHDCRVVELGPGAHYLQEDHPQTIGESIADWIAENERARQSGIAA